MARRRTKLLLVLAIAVCSILGSVGIADAVTVGVRGIFNGTSYVWSPKTRSVARGTTVRWKAVNGSHTVKSRGANWTFFRNVPAGTAVMRTFNRAGTYRFFCTIHGSVVNGVCSGMCGRVVVG
jgi:plastocyanin